MVNDWSNEETEDDVDTEDKTGNENVDETCAKNMNLVNNQLLKDIKTCHLIQTKKKYSTGKVGHTMRMRRTSGTRSEIIVSNNKVTKDNKTEQANLELEKSFELFYRLLDFPPTTKSCMIAHSLETTKPQPEARFHGKRMFRDAVGSDEYDDNASIEHSMNTKAALGCMTKEIETKSKADDDPTSYTYPLFAFEKYDEPMFTCEKGIKG